ncbi:MAG TPA: hypothetical protein VF310_03350 [Vicinamibacteria bacterium]
MSASRLAVVVAAAALASSACLVQVSHVRDPGPLFREARAEAARFTGRPGPARQVNVLVWSPDEHELVRVSVPMWVVRQAVKHADWDEVDVGDADDRHLKEILKRRLNPQELEKAGLGLLVEVEEEEGEQVLVWLR